MLKEMNEYSYKQMQEWLAEHHYEFDDGLCSSYCICIWDGPDFYVLYYDKTGKLNHVNIEKEEEGVDEEYFNTFVKYNGPITKEKALNAFSIAARVWGNEW